jgi:hypothetical protein
MFDRVAEETAIQSYYKYALTHMILSTFMTRRFHAIISALNEITRNADVKLLTRCCNQFTRILACNCGSKSGEGEKEKRRQRFGWVKEMSASYIIIVVTVNNVIGAMLPSLCP